MKTIITCYDKIDKVVFDIMCETVIRRGISKKLLKQLNKKQIEKIYHIVKGLYINNDKNERNRDE
jgi:hypothetical protein